MKWFSAPAHLPRAIRPQHCIATAPPLYAQRLVPWQLVARPGAPRTTHANSATKADALFSATAIDAVDVLHVNGNGTYSSPPHASMLWAGAAQNTSHAAAGCGHGSELRGSMGADVIAERQAHHAHSQAEPAGPSGCAASSVALLRSARAAHQRAAQSTHMPHMVDMGNAQQATHPEQHGQGVLQQSRQMQQAHREWQQERQTHLQAISSSTDMQELLLAYQHLNASLTRSARCAPTNQSASGTHSDAAGSQARPDLALTITAARQAAQLLNPAHQRQGSVQVGQSASMLGASGPAAPRLNPSQREEVRQACRMLCAWVAPHVLSRGPQEPQSVVPPGGKRASLRAPSSRKQQPYSQEPGRLRHIGPQAAASLIHSLAAVAHAVGSSGVAPAVVQALTRNLLHTDSSSSDQAANNRQQRPVRIRHHLVVDAVWGLATLGSHHLAGVAGVHASSSQQARQAGLPDSDLLGQVLAWLYHTTEPQLQDMSRAQLVCLLWAAAVLQEGAGGSHKGPPASWWQAVEATMLGQPQAEASNNGSMSGADGSAAWGPRQEAAQGARILPLLQNMSSAQLAVSAWAAAQLLTATSKQDSAQRAAKVQSAQASHAASSPRPTLAWLHALLAASYRRSSSDWLSGEHLAMLMSALSSLRCKPPCSWVVHILANAAPASQHRQPSQNQALIAQQRGRTAPRAQSAQSAASGVPVRRPRPLQGLRPAQLQQVLAALVALHVEVPQRMLLQLAGVLQMRLGVCGAAQLLLCARNMMRLGLAQPPRFLLGAWLEELHAKLPGLTPIHAIQLLELLAGWGVSPGTCWLSDFLDAAASQAALPRYSRSKLVNLLAAMADLGMQLQVDSPAVHESHTSIRGLNGHSQSIDHCTESSDLVQASASSNVLQGSASNGWSLGLEPHLVTVPPSITAAVVQSQAAAVHPSLQSSQPGTSCSLQSSQPVVGDAYLQSSHPLQSAPPSVSCSLQHRRAWVALVLRTFASRKHARATEDQLSSLLRSLDALCSPPPSAWDPELWCQLEQVVKATAPKGWSGQLPARPSMHAAESTEESTVRSGQHVSL